MITSPEDEIYAGLELIGIADVTARLDVLKPWHIEDRRSEAAISLAEFKTQDEAEDWIGETEDDDLHENLLAVDYTDQSEERDALIDLLTELEGTGSETAVAILKSAWPDMARDQASDLYGHDAVAGLDDFIDWDAYQAAASADMTETEYRGTTYLVSAH